MSPKLSLATRPVSQEEAKLAEFNELIATGLSGAEAQGTVWPDADAEAELEALAEAALEAQQAEKDAATKAKSATEAFRKALDAAGKLNPDNHATGIVRTVIYPTKRFDEELARKILTKKLAKECEKTVLDSAKVKANVAPAVYESMQVVSGMTLKLSINKTEA